MYIHVYINSKIAIWTKEYKNRFPTKTRGYLYLQDFFSFFATLYILRKDN